ncbi:MAG: M48 family metallopeptidase [Verrucomicrobiales bacterium]
MDFFEHQEKARKRTHLLVFYFGLALIGIVAAIYGLALFVFAFTDAERTPGQSFDFWDPVLLGYCAVGTFLVVFFASAFKTMQLSGGGAVVARELGGRELDANTTDFHERRLLNVVEEMAIAAGMPVPSVYVLEGEDSINAFAAGKSTSDAVVGVTRGCMTLLTRDELQGVIAHEFSHILNGDMRLNIRLMGLLFGILFLALVGELIFRSSFFGSVRSNRRSGGGGAIVMLIAGLGLLLIGYIGSFFANLIKASVSRQREFLADASAVQFTRNPDGIGGALRKIGGLGSNVEHPMAKDASHLFFGSAFSSQLFSTHPPLSERIKRLLPDWNGEFGSVKRQPVTEQEEPSEKAPRRRPAGPPIFPGMFLDGAAGESRMTGPEAAESMKSVHPEQVALGHELREALPADWVEACRSRSGAQAMVFALLLAEDETLCREELEFLGAETDPSTRDAVAKLVDGVQPIHSAVKLGLVDLAIPSLRHLSPEEYRRFRKIMRQLIASDRQVDLFEFALARVVSRHLDTFFHERKPEKIRYRRFDRLRDETGILLSTLAALSHRGDDAAAREAFDLAARHLHETDRVEVPHKSGEECGLDRIEAALDKFAEATPILKKRLLEACGESILADGVVTSREAELVRAIADTMGCPLPPFVRTAQLA